MIKVGMDTICIRITCSIPTQSHIQISPVTVPFCGG